MRACVCVRVCILIYVLTYLHVCVCVCVRIMCACELQRARCVKIPMSELLLATVIVATCQRPLGKCRKPARSCQTGEQHRCALVCVTTRSLPVSEKRLLTLFPCSTRGEQYCFSSGVCVCVMTNTVFIKVAYINNENSLLVAPHLVRAQEVCKGLQMRDTHTPTHTPPPSPPPAHRRCALPYIHTHTHTPPPTHTHTHTYTYTPRACTQASVPLSTHY